MSTVAVLGAGSWGTAFAKVAADAGSTVTLWARRAEVADAINRTGRNPDYLSGVTLPASVTSTTDAAEAFSRAEVVAFALPAQELRGHLGSWRSMIGPGTTLVSLMKGIELGSGRRMSEVIAEATGADPADVLAITGPNLAWEIAHEQPAATVVAGVSEQRARQVQRLCGTTYLRLYTNVDIVGCELGGAVKNVIAMACGMAEGMGFGDNTRASIMTRGLAETARLGVALGAEQVTFAGLAGLGDLVATCASPLSRNRSLGERLGRGVTLAAARTDGRQCAEGADSCVSIRDLARSAGVDMPITEHVAKVCAGELTPADMVAALMGRTPRPE